MKHLFCLSAILFLAAFVAREKLGDRDSSVQPELVFAFQNALAEIDFVNQKILNGIYRNVKYYRSAQNLEYGGRAKTAAAKTDALLHLLDSVAKKPSEELAREVQRQINLHRPMILELADKDSGIAAEIPDFLAADWLFQSFQTDSPARFASVVAAAKVKICLFENALLNYCAQKTAHCGLIIVDTFQPMISFAQLAPNVGEAVSADLLLTQFSPASRYKLLLDGRELKMEDGVGRFQVKLEKVGLQPLRLVAEVLDWETDSVETWEKTYFLNVRE